MSQRFVIVHRIVKIRSVKRIELFEFEDDPRFPAWLRDLMTAYLRAFHRIFRTAPAVAELLRQAINVSPLAPSSKIQLKTFDFPGVLSSFRDEN